MKFKKGQVPKNKLSQEEFLRRCENKHKGFYDYSAVVYKSMTDRIDIICPEHGKFNQIARNHLRGDRCTHCARKITSSMRKLKFEDFLEKSLECHGGKYTYKEVNLKSNTDLVEITCPIHGLFKQSASFHMNGGGCKKCSASKRAEEKKDKAFSEIKLHLETHHPHIRIEKYITSKEIYAKCDLHNKSYKTCKTYLERGVGCDACMDKARKGRLDKRLSNVLLEKMIRSHKHGRYTYDNFNATRKGDMVEVYCTVHNKNFLVRCSNHIRGDGYGECPDCYEESKLGKAKDDFLSKACEIHGGLYSYNIDEYLNCKLHISITCNNCDNVFMQTPDNHLQGKGCPDCNSISVYSKSVYVENSKKRHGGLCNIYLIRCYNEVEDFYKVGITVHNLNQRFGTDLAMPYSYQTMFFKQGKVEDIVELETEIHHKVRAFRYAPKIQFGGSVKECFTKGGLESTISMFKEFKEFNNGTS